MVGDVNHLTALYKTRPGTTTYFRAEVKGSLNPSLFQIPPSLPKSLSLSNPSLSQIPPSHKSLPLTQGRGGEGGGGSQSLICSIPSLPIIPCRTTRSPPLTSRLNYPAVCVFCLPPPPPFPISLNCYFLSMILMQLSVYLPILYTVFPDNPT